jgi:succinyl-CoA synthetase alpha subunit
MGPLTRCLVRPDTYRDSVVLMRVAAELERLPGVARAALMMATPANRGLLAEAGLLDGDAVAAGPGDLVIAVAAADARVAGDALASAARLLDRVAAAPASTAETFTAPRTIAEAAALGGANLAMISTPGAYATAEALKALKRGLSVFLFSDNVPIEDEIELKRLAVGKRLLMMGPDCGTAIVDGIPLGFANAVRRGRIGLAGASGTGLQQVSCLVDRLGEGVSQVIGVGSRDLDERVGGLMMRGAIERLAADPATAVIVLVSKPPAAAVGRDVLDLARASGKPVVVSFVGAAPAPIEAAGAFPAATLADAARLAVALARGEPTAGPPPAVRHPLLAGTLARPGRLAASQRHVRGLYSGGTLCQEAKLILAVRDAAPAGHTVIDRNHTVIDRGHTVIDRGHTVIDRGHTVIDLGDDAFTVGRPHPMIDFRLRNEHIAAAAADPTTAVILLDVVLGYGAHPNPAGALLPAIDGARGRSGGRAVAFVASVCGTAGDPQNLARQEAALSAAGVILAPSNAEAARLAARLAGAVAGA